MTLTGRIKLLCSPLNHTFASIEREFGFGQGTIRKWDISVPSADKLLKVAKLLNTTTDWLLTGNELSNNIAIPPDQQELLELYSQLDERKKGEVIGYTKALINNQ